jgi:hypothetical protein
MRTEDALGWLRFLRSHSWGGAKLSEWHAVGVGEAAIPALHAAALAGDVFTSVRLERSVRSWEDIARSSETHDQLVNMVHGVLRHYDLPELVALVGRERVKVLHPVDACNRPLP